ncbi:MAG TPA: pilin, partial [Micromonosporaceae bacterium]|nr:pilin [Micromonosporaceae bacterium]
IQQVAERIRTWLLAILVAVATLFLTVGGLRYLAANGDPGELEKAKLALRSAAIGYALALLAPLFVTIVGQWVA